MTQFESELQAAAENSMAPDSTMAEVVQLNNHADQRNADCYPIVPPFAMVLMPLGKVAWRGIQRGMQGMRDRRANPAEEQGDLPC